MDARDHARTKPESPTRNAPSWISFQSVWKKRDYYLVQRPNTNRSGESRLVFLLIWFVSWTKKQ